MKRTLLGTAMAIMLASCGPPIGADVDPRSACEADVREDLLNPETAEFYDFGPVDVETFKAAVIPPLQAQFNYPGGKTIPELEIRRIESAERLYRMRVRAEGQLGNKITSAAYCRQLLTSAEMCSCTLVE